MSVARQVFGVLLALQLTPGAAAQQAGKPPVLTQFQWSLSCPADPVGADGQPLCSAEYIGYPRLNVSRTDAGMSLLTTVDCGRARNGIGQEVPAYRKIGINVPLKRGIPAERIQRLILLNLKDFPNLIRRTCPLSSNGGTFDLEEGQLPAMINSVFVIKQARY
ncbi:hypothetical protein [Sphingomonas sp. NPDC079357]|uniref:hypothetical protein n=1 Tax=Sphingomonas sp. NPDC079357 TaxID=3364518 RepID=UPI00384E3887